MQEAAKLGGFNPLTTNLELRPRTTPGERLSSVRVPAVLSAIAACTFFVCDILVPRGATPAIGYALAPSWRVGAASGRL